MKTLILLTIISLLSVSVSAQSPSPPDPPPTEEWSLQRLDLEVTVDPEGEKVVVNGTLTVRLEEESSNGPALILNSRENVMQFRSLSAEGVSAVFFPFPENPVVQVALLKLPRSFTKGDTLEIAFAAESSKQSSQFVARDDVVFASWVEFWYPIPASVDKGPSSPAAPGTTRFILPKGWRSVGNGELTSSTSTGTNTIEVWGSDEPAARSFVAAPFVQVTEVERDGRTISFFLLKERTSADAQAGALASALSAMERRFGPYPYATYNVAEIPEGISFAAASEQGFIMVRSSVLDNESGSLPLFAHEAAHGWWGNLVRGDDPGGKMVSEALAQYGAVVAIESIEGRDAMVEFLRFSREGYNPLQCALGYFFMWNDGGDKPLMELAGDKWDHNIADSKGMWFYHMLRERMGDEIFFSTLRGLIRDFSSREFTSRQMTMNDLRAAFLAAAPDDKELAAFMGQWLDRHGAPVLRVDWWSIERGKKAELHIQQLQAGDPFVFPLDVFVQTADGRVVEHTINVDSATQTFEIDTPARPLEIRIDPHHRLLMWRPEFGPRPRQPDVKENLQ